MCVVCTTVGGWAGLIPPKSGLPLDLGLKIIMDGRVRYHNLIEYNFIHIRIYLSRAFFSILFLDLDCRFLGRTPRV